MKATCWLIGDWSGRFPLLVAQFARLRDLEIEFRPVGDGGFASIPAQPKTLVVASIEQVNRLGGQERRLLRSIVDNGGTAYFRGAVRCGNDYSLAPFEDRCFSVARWNRASGYRLADNSLVPRVVAAEQVTGDFDLPVAQGLGPAAVPLLLARQDGNERPVIFAFRSGAGVAIYDVNPDEEGPEAPLLDRLADPRGRYANIGALIAVDRAAGRDTDYLPSYNLTIDDRPANFDYFTVAEIEGVLRHISERCPQTHIDFAWIPSHQYPSRRYVDVLKKFRTGIVWHGFCRHVDHRTLHDPRLEIGTGRRLVRHLADKFGMHWQPIMIFPFEKCSTESLETLKHEGFLASAEDPDFAPERYEAAPRYLRGSVPLYGSLTRDFPILQRHSVNCLTRDRMLALAVLGLPIIACAHPDDIGITRFSRFLGRGGSFSHFDPVLDFVRAKGLPSQSLEGIALDLISERERQPAN